MESRLPAWTSTIEQLDAALRPIAAAPVALADLASPDARQRFANPLEQAGVAEAAAALMTEILDAYSRANAADRCALRRLFSEHRALGWAAGFLMPFSADLASARRQLLLFSLLDQGTDARDALLWLRAFCGQPGVDCDALPELMREVAALSSAVDHYHMGSTASMLMAAASEISRLRAHGRPRIQ
jgi:hypothetical protein